MEAAKLVAIFIAIFVAIFCPMMLAFDPSGKERSAAKDRRMAEHRLNARLLRLNI
jgi:hypothetical protein